MAAIKTNNLSVDVYPGRNQRVFYLLMPLLIDRGFCERLVDHYGCTIAVIEGMDWDNDLTPWPAENVPATDPPFEGNAAKFLQELIGEVLPAVEGGAKVHRTLCGVSLSGLFTTWAWMQGDAFDNIASISGSMWYPGFVDWMRRHVVAKPGVAYFSLGNKEGAPHDHKAFRTVRLNTLEVVDILSQAGIRSMFEPTPGNHFAPIEPRLLQMMEGLRQLEREKSDKYDA